MNKKTQFILVSCWILATRFYDAYSTYQFTPALDKEANPLVSVLGLGWTPLLAIISILTLIIIYAYYLVTFKSFDLTPKVRGYSLKEFISFTYFGTKENFVQIFYKIPKGRKRLLFYVGNLFPSMLSFAGLVSTLMWLGINYYEPYYNFHKAQYIYILLIISCLFIIYNWYKKMYNKYLESNE